MVSINNIKISLCSILIHALIGAKEAKECVAFGGGQIISSNSWRSKRPKTYDGAVGIRTYTSSLMYATQYRDNNNNNNNRRNHGNQGNRSGPVRKPNNSFKEPIILGNPDDDLNVVLQRCNFDSRLLTVHDTDLPIVAEVHTNSKWQLCIITNFKVPSSIISSEDVNDKQCEISPPLVKVILINEGEDYHNDEIMEKSSCVVDIGQITAVWNTRFKKEMNINDIVMGLSKQVSKVDSSMQKLPVNQIEKSMQRLYEDCTEQDPRAVNKGLSKKDVTKISSVITPPARAQHLEQILRRGLKAGMNGSKKLRLVTSQDATEYLFDGNGNDSSSLLVGATSIARDAELGGRFKRTGCIFVAAKYEKGEDGPFVREVNILNGGWTAVDTSVRAGTEARKFVERRTEGETATGFTTADERILYRLECFAMGEVLEADDGSQQLEVDLRETLSAMNLPLTPNGAQAALIQSGRWSPSNSSKNRKRMFEPWANKVLESARMLVDREEKRKKKILKIFMENGVKPVEDRINLVSLPVVCVDAKRASFRDDAIGVRPRSSTGRKVNKAASKWEILVHIADVSDLYASQVSRPADDNFDFNILRKAAEGRGASRYDLPFGPLHLMPPIALEALALVTRGTKNKPPINRCVTLWAYIDERNGKLIDAGLERTIIPAPIGLTFESASAILDDKEVNIDVASYKQAKAVLGIAERNLSLWKENRLQTEKSAAKREYRMRIKELVAKETMRGQDMRDDGASGSFQRTRGHRLVDQSLDLYGSTLSKLLLKAKAPIPRASGSTSDRDGRVATAPLRRYIDGLAQRQALSVLCNYGGPAMTKKDCTIANQKVNDATNKSRKLAPPQNQGNSKRKKSLQMLESHLSTIGNSKKRVVPALSTGKQNEVVISGLGITVKCGGVKGTLRSGLRVLVEITKLNADKGILQVQLVDDSKK